MSSVTHLVLSTFWLLTACSAGSPPLSKSDADPSNPNAPAGAPIEIARAEPVSSVPEPPAAPSPGPSHDAHSGHAHAPKAKTEYTCSMHPEVSATAPGRCPKCGMDLVPKK